MATGNPGRKGLDRRNLIQGALVGGGYSLLGKTARAEAPAPVAPTRHGKVRGVTVNGIHLFRAIPYGSSTADKGRFQPPRKPTAWKGELDVSRGGRRCIQGTGSLFTNELLGPFFSGGQVDRMGVTEEINSEDCLNLNVLTPGLERGKHRPVLVYIHGGGFSGGSGIMATAGDAVPRENDVVLISVNHRLNVFGYLYLGEIDPGYADSGNVGMLDLVAALQWIRDNIENFGGDPGNVTIFGESGGGAKISALLAMPMAQGLFHKAIVQSGSGLRVQTREDATKNARALMAAHNLSDRQIPELLKIPADALYRTKGFRSQPVVDGRSIPKQTWDPVAPDVSARIPMIIGTCKDEASLGMDKDPAMFKLTETSLREHVAKMRIPASEVDRVLSVYRTAMPKASPSDRYMAIGSDRGTRADAITQAERKATQGKAPVYKYFLKYEPPIADGRLRSLHTTELPLLFRLVKYPGSEKLSKQLATAWATFARKGHPSHCDLGYWPPYNLKDRATMVFDANQSLVENDPDAARRSLWQSVKADSSG